MTIMAQYIEIGIHFASPDFVYRLSKHLILSHNGNKVFFIAITEVANMKEFHEIIKLSILLFMSGKVEAARMSTFRGICLKDIF